MSSGFKVILCVYQAHDPYTALGTCRSGNGSCSPGLISPGTEIKLASMRSLKLPN